MFLSVSNITYFAYYIHSCPIGWSSLVPRRLRWHTLRERVQREVCVLFKKITNSPANDLSEEIKRILSNVSTLEENMFPFRITDVTKVAFVITETKYRFNVNGTMAGNRWFYSCKKTHNDLSLYQAEVISKAGSNGFNKDILLICWIC
jgi:hypothetical protein